MDALAALLQSGQTSIANVLFTHYQKSDLTPQEFLLYLFLTHWGQTHQEAPEPAVLAKAIKLPQSAMFTLLTNLINKKAIAVVTKDDGQGHLVDRYDVSPLLHQYLDDAGSQKAVLQNETDAQQVFSQIEIEFGRPLSPIEQQTITAWLNEDHYSPELIRLALKEAVLNQVYSFKYMDRILINWTRRHLTTAKQVQAAKNRDNSL